MEDRRLNHVLISVLYISLEFKVEECRGKSVFDYYCNMASTPPTPSNRTKSVKKFISQKQGRRKTSLMKKASEYSKMFDADVCGGIRLRETGQNEVEHAQIARIRTIVGKWPVGK